MRSSATAPTADPFTPEGVDLQPVSPTLITVRLLSSALGAALLAAAGTALGLLVSPWLHAITAAAVLGLALRLWLVPRQVRAMGYALTDDHLLWRHGVMFRSISVIPYGRMQFVDTSQGPLSARLGIASVRLHTASASTDATIRGLPVDRAEHLRQVLSQRGEERMAGL